MDLSLDKHFDQADSITSELVSLIDLITENNSSSRNASQSTLTIGGLIVYNYKKGTHKRKSTVQKVSINQIRKREISVVTYISFKLHSSTLKKALLQRLHQTGICPSYHHVIDITFDWTVNELQLHKINNQVIPLKLRWIVFIVFTKDNIDKNSKSNEATKHFDGTSIWVKAFKNGSSKICGKQPLKNSKGYGLFVSQACNFRNKETLTHAYHILSNF